jgi:hypothetical protein
VTSGCAVSHDTRRSFLPSFLAESLAPRAIQTSCPQPIQPLPQLIATMASAMDLSTLEKDPRLFLYTSLTAGSSHIITATSRMETILKANKIPFTAIDTATDEKARRLWQRRAGQRKLPGLVKEGYVLGVCASFAPI